MRKLISSTVIVGTMILLLIPVQPVQPLQPVTASGYRVHYTVRYACLVGPWPPIGAVVGEWDQDCEGNMTGWGMQPGDGCTTTETSSFEPCY